MFIDALAAFGLVARRISRPRMSYGDIGREQGTALFVSAVRCVRFYYSLAELAIVVVVVCVLIATSLLQTECLQIHCKGTDL